MAKSLKTQLSPDDSVALKERRAAKRQYSNHPDAVKAEIENFKLMYPWYAKLVEGVVDTLRDRVNDSSLEFSVKL